jgi:hypothetical protein
VQLIRSRWGTAGLVPIKKACVKIKKKADAAVPNQENEHLRKR